MIIDIESTTPPPEWGVEIDVDAIAEMASALSDRRFPPAAFDYDGLPAWEGEDWARLALLGTSVMACLWPEDGSEMWSIDWEGRRLSDAPAVWACFARAFPDGISLDALATMDAERFFAGHGVLQLIADRETALRNVARCIIDRYNGRALELADRASHNAPSMVRLLVDDVPGFHDRIDVEEGTLPFDKLAHLAVAAMAARIPTIRRLNAFPVYPDYMLPMVLRHHGVLVYRADLAAKVDSRTVIDAGDPQEVAIRWATVSAASTLRHRLNGLGNPVDTPTLDYHLWSSAVLGPEAGTMGEHHRTITMRY